MSRVATRDGYVMIDGWKTQTAFMPQDLIRDLQRTGIAGIIHKGTERLDSEFDEVLALTNAERAEVGCPALTVNNTLGIVAQAHAQDMAENDWPLRGRIRLSSVFLR